MAINAQTTKIYILDRITYDTLSQIPESEGGIKTNGVYFIRETSSQTAKIASLCVGKSNQCDVLDISDLANVDFTDPAHNYNIPVDYRVKDKLLFYSQTDSDNKKYYRTLMWDGSSFLDCIGGKIIQPDGITIKANEDNVIHGVGADFTGLTRTVGGNTYTAGTSAEVFNYTGNDETDNIGLGDYSSTKGANNINFGDYSDVSGNGNTNNAEAANVFGQGNIVPSDTWKGKLYGGQNNFNPSGTGISVCIGNGSTSDNKSNAMIGDFSGNMYFAGNVKSGTGATLSTVRTILNTIVADDSTYTFAILPANGQEVIISNEYTVETINITDITKMPRADSDNRLSGDSSSVQNRTNDYNCLITFKKSDNLTSIEDAISNFTAEDNTKINLLNPDIDISESNIIHIFLFYDGFSICAIAAGYTYTKYPDVWPEIVSDDYFMYDSNKSSQEVTLTLNNVQSGKLLLLLISSYDVPATLPDSSWTLVRSGTLTYVQSGYNLGRNLYIYKKIAVSGTNSVTIKTSPNTTGSYGMFSSRLIAVPDATDVSVKSVSTQIEFTNNETELDTTVDEHRMYVYFTNAGGNGVSLPSPIPTGLNNVDIRNYDLIRSIYQYTATITPTTLTGVSTSGSTITGKFDLWTLQFT